MWALLLVLLASCEDAVELDLGNFEPKLVVVSNFAPDEPLEVFVSKTRSVLNNDAPHYISDATVQLYRGDNLLETLQYVPASGDQPPRYISSTYTPEIGTPYTLRAETPKFGPVEAQSVIPQAAAIRALNIADVSAQQISPDSLAFFYRVEIVFSDPPNVQNYYHLNFYQQTWDYIVEEGDTVIVRSNFKNVNFSSENDNNAFIAYFDGGVLFDDSFFNGRAISYSFTLRTNIRVSRELLGKMFVELRTTSQDYFLYHNSLSRQQTSSGGPLAEPVIIYNNIENGRGIFAGYNPAIDSAAIR